MPPSNGMVRALHTIMYGLAGRCCCGANTPLFWTNLSGFSFSLISYIDKWMRVKNFRGSAQDKFSFHSMLWIGMHGFNIVSSQRRWPWDCSSVRWLYTFSFRLCHNCTATMTADPHTWHPSKHSIVSDKWRPNEIMDGIVCCAPMCARHFAKLVFP